MILGCNHASSKVENDHIGPCDCALTADNTNTSSADVTACDVEPNSTGESLATTDEASDTAVDGATSTSGESLCETFCNDATDCFSYPWVAAPKATREVRVSATLDRESEFPPISWDMADPRFAPGAASNFFLAIFVFDSLGISRRIDIYFAISTEREWNYYLVCDADDISGDDHPHEFVLIGYGALSFTEDGRLYSETIGQMAPLNFKGAAPNQTITFDFGRSVVEGDTGWHGVTTSDFRSEVWSRSQDGHDGSGNWMCVQNRCVQHFFHCAAANGIGCCGDGTCRAEDGKNSNTCPSDCNWQCRIDADCAGGQWDATPQASRNVTFSINLDSGTVAPELPFDPTSPEQTSNHNEKVTVYDSEGTPHVVTVYFRKADLNEWEWYALAMGEEVISGPRESQIVFASGILHFTSDGFLDATEVTRNASVDFTDARSSQWIAFHFSTRDNPWLLTTQYAANTELRWIRQDGHNGTGHWQCSAERQCVPVFTPCGVFPTVDCCGDGICKTDLGMDGQTCPSSCPAD